MRNNSRKKRKISWISIAIVAFALFAAFRISSRVIQYVDLKQNASYYQEQLAVAQTEYDEKLHMVDLLNNGAYIERIAREDLGMVRNGETLVSVVQISQENDQNWAAAAQKEYDGSQTRDLIE